PVKPSGEIAVLSGVGIYPERNIQLVTWRIDGKEVDHNRTSEFHLLPGDHIVNVFVRKDLMVTSAFGVRWQEAYIDIPLKAEAGHTYIADV
ncbi:hypothetical protein PJH10_29480, partial [Mycobacterium kansasii]